jgi:hypothetical protein
MFVLIHFSHWFINTGHGLFCFTSCFTGSSSLGMVCIAWLRASLVLHYWVWFVLFHFAHWFIIIKHDLYLLFEDSLVHHHWAWFVLFDYTLHWFFLTGRGSHCFISWVTGSLLLGRFFLPHTSLVHHYLAWSVLWFQASLVHHYWGWFVLLD